MITYKEYKIKVKESNNLPYHHLKDDGYITFISIDVYKDDIIIADFYFLYNKKDFLFPEMANVDEEHQRKGIATFVYNTLENLYNCKIIKPDNHSDKAKAFWSSRK